MVAINGRVGDVKPFFVFFLLPPYFRFLSRGKQQVLGDALGELSQGISATCVALCGPGRKSPVLRTLRRWFEAAGLCPNGQVLMAELFYFSDSCSVLIWASSAREYSRSACSSICSFFTRPSKRNTSTLSLLPSKPLVGLIAGIVKGAWE